MQTLMQNAPLDDRVYLFMMKKKAEGKPYHVYMTAGANKFLRIYYGTVKAHLATESQTEQKCLPLSVFKPAINGGSFIVPAFTEISFFVFFSKSA